MGIYHREPWPADEIGKAAIEKMEAAHAASEIEDEERREVSPFFGGLMIALGLTAACLIVAHLLARFVL